MAPRSDHNKRNQGCQGLSPFQGQGLVTLMVQLNRQKWMTFPNLRKGLGLFQGQGPVTLMVQVNRQKWMIFPNLKKGLGPFQGQGPVTLMVQVNMQKWMTFPNLKSLCILISLSHLVYMCTTSPQKFHVGFILQVIICTKPPSSNYMFVVALQISFLHFQVNFFYFQFGILHLVMEHC